MYATVEEAIQKLDQLYGETLDLKNSKERTGVDVRWKLLTEAFFDDVFGPSSRYSLAFKSLRWSHTGTYILTPQEVAQDDPVSAGSQRVNVEARKTAYAAAQGILLAAKEELKLKGLQQVYDSKNSAPEASLILKVINCMEVKLRKLFHDAPTNERQVQDEVEKLFIGADIPYSREADSIEYSSKTYRPDFTVAKAELAIDVKICHRDGREKEIIAEINDDILAYRTKYSNLLFVIYDCGCIRDVDRFAASFEAHGAILVRVVKH